MIESLKRSAVVIEATSFGKTARKESDRKMKNMLKLAAIPTLMFLAAESAAFAVGFEGTKIPTNYYQLLDTTELANNPLASLMYLHSQPPMFNLLLALILKLSRLFGTPDKTIATIIFLLVGFAGVIFFFSLICRITGSTLQAALGVLVLLFSPAYHVFGNMYFYPFILQALFLALFFFIAKYVEEGSVISLCLVIFAIALITNTRSLFHPAWAICLYLLVITFGKWISRERYEKTVAPEIKRTMEPKGKKSRNVLIGLATLILLLSIWPLKNYLIFKQFTYSSMTGYNLSHYLPINPVSKNTGPVVTVGEVIITGMLDGESKEVSEYLASSNEVSEYLASFRPVFANDSLRVLTDKKKTDGSLNWNHAVFLLSTKPLMEHGIRWRLNNPIEYLRITLVHYLIWTSPSAMHPYTQENRGPQNPLYQSYAQTYNKLLCANMRTSVERLTPGLKFHKTAYVKGEPVRYTFYGLVFFPIVLISALAFIAFNLKKKRALEAVVATGIFCHIFAMVVVCLTDGQEGNRISFSTFPAVIMVAGYSFNEALVVIRSKTRLSGRADPRGKEPPAGEGNRGQPLH